MASKSRNVSPPRSDIIKTRQQAALLNSPSRVTRSQVRRVSATPATLAMSPKSKMRGKREENDDETVAVTTRPRRASRNPSICYSEKVELPKRKSTVTSSSSQKGTQPTQKSTRSKAHLPNEEALNPSVPIRRMTRQSSASSVASSTTVTSTVFSPMRRTRGRQNLSPVPSVSTSDVSTLAEIEEASSFPKSNSSYLKTDTDTSSAKSNPPQSPEGAKKDSSFGPPVMQCSDDEDMFKESPAAESPSVKNVGSKENKSPMNFEAFIEKPSSLRQKSPGIVTTSSRKSSSTGTPKFQVSPLVKSQTPVTYSGTETIFVSSLDEPSRTSLVPSGKGNSLTPSEKHLRRSKLSLSAKKSPKCDLTPNVDRNSTTPSEKLIPSSKLSLSAKKSPKLEVSPFYDKKSEDSKVGNDLVQSAEARRLSLKESQNVPSNSSTESDLLSQSQRLSSGRQSLNRSSLGAGFQLHLSLSDCAPEEACQESDVTAQRELEVVESDEDEEFTIRKSEDKLETSQIEDGGLTNSSFGSPVKETSSSNNSLSEKSVEQTSPSKSKVTESAFDNAVNMHSVESPQGLSAAESSVSEENVHEEAVECMNSPGSVKVEKDQGGTVDSYESVRKVAGKPRHTKDVSANVMRDAAFLLNGGNISDFDGSDSDSNHWGPVFSPSTKSKKETRLEKKAKKKAEKEARKKLKINQTIMLGSSSHEKLEELPASPSEPSNDMKSDSPDRIVSDEKAGKSKKSDSLSSEEVLKSPTEVRDDHTSFTKVDDFSPSSAVKGTDFDTVSDDMGKKKIKKRKRDQDSGDSCLELKKKKKKKNKKEVNYVDNTAEFQESSVNLCVLASHSVAGDSLKKIKKKKKKQSLILETEDDGKLTNVSVPSGAEEIGDHLILIKKKKKPIVSGKLSGLISNKKKSEKDKESSQFSSPAIVYGVMNHHSNDGSDSDDGPSSISFSASKEVALAEIQAAAENIRKQKERKKEKLRLKQEKIREQKLAKAKKLKNKLKRANASASSSFQAGIQERTLSSEVDPKEVTTKKPPKRLPADLLHSLSEEPPTKIMKVSESVKGRGGESDSSKKNEERMKKTEAKKLALKLERKKLKESDYIPLEGVLAQTRFGVVPLRNIMIAKKLAKNKQAEEAATFRKESLFGNRHRRTPISAILAHQEKMRASGKDRLV